MWGMKQVLDRAQSLTPGQCVTLIYTSGTTGPPKVGGCVSVCECNLIGKEGFLIVCACVCVRGGGKGTGVCYSVRVKSNDRCP